MISRLFLLTSAFAVAGETPVVREPFRIEKTFTATALPAEPVVLSLEPDSWSGFVVEEIAAHGSEVKKGERILACEREDYDRQLEDLGRGVEKQSLAVKKAELDLAKLEKDTDIQLDAARRAKRNADEDLKYFQETGRPAAEKQAEHGVKISRFQLAATEEELKQLQAMYDEDDLTEETEEIILERQKFAVEDAKFDLKAAERRAELTLKSSLPRQEEELVKAAKEAAASLEKLEKSLPADLEVSKLELASAKSALQRQETELERLKSDGALLEWKAPVDGVLLHGGIEDGRWELGELAKALRPGGSLPLRRGILSIAPKGSASFVTAEIDSEIANQLSEKSPVTAHPQGREDLTGTGTIEKIDSIVGANGRRQVTLEISWPQGFAPSPAASLSCDAVVYSNDETLTLPKEALTSTGDEWSVTVKLADGSTESRKVERGRVGEKKAEVLSGVEAGQVVVTPN